MTDLSGSVGYPEVALALVLVVLAGALSAVRRLGLERDVAWASARAFVQLLLVGLVLEQLFRGAAWASVPALAVMVVAAAHTAGRRARAVPSSAFAGGLAVAAALASTLGLLAALRIVPVAPRAIVPLGSMIASNAMVTAALVMTRLHDDLATQRREVEARLSLAQPSRQAAAPWLRAALRAGMLPIVESTKVVGLVSLPGAMTGMILAGATPLAAIRLQLVVMYMLLAGNAFAALVAGELALRRLFTPAHQLLRTVRRPDS